MHLTSPNKKGTVPKGDYYTWVVDGSGEGVPVVGLALVVASLIVYTIAMLTMQYYVWVCFGFVATIICGHPFLVAIHRSRSRWLKVNGNDYYGSGSSLKDRWYKTIVKLRAAATELDDIAAGMPKDSAFRQPVTDSANLVRLTAWEVAQGYTQAHRFLQRITSLPKHIVDILTNETKLAEDRLKKSETLKCTALELSFRYARMGPLRDHLSIFIHELAEVSNALRELNEEDLLDESQLLEVS